MTKQNKNANLKDFFVTMPGSKEVGLVIAKNEAELNDFAGIAAKEGFRQSKSASELLTILGKSAVGKIQKMYIIIQENIGKDLYDFVVQYPTGQVEIFDKKLMRSQTFTPDYGNSAVVLLVAKDDLNKLQAQGFNLFASIGLAYQS